MRALILAGGEGIRLRPLTNDRPKPMVEVCGKPILEHQIRQLRQAGITDITVLESYLPHVIQSHFGDGSRFGIDMTHIVAGKELQSGGAIKKGLESISPLERNVLVLFGDIISNVDLRKLMKQHVTDEALLTAVCIPERSQYGIWQTDEEGRVSSFLEKPPQNTNAEYLP